MAKAPAWVMACATLFSIVWFWTFWTSGFAIPSPVTPNDSPSEQLLTDKTLVILRAAGDVGFRKRQLIKRYVEALDGFAQFSVHYDVSSDGKMMRAADVGALLRALEGEFGRAHMNAWLYNTTDILTAFPFTEFEIGYRKNYDPFDDRKGVKVPVTYQGGIPSTVLFLRTLPPEVVERLDHVWVIEDDAEYAGDLRKFFLRYLEDPSHIITSRLRPMPYAWWWERSYSWQAHRANRTVCEDHLVRYSARLLSAMDDFLAAGVYSLGVQYPTTICASLEWCKTRMRNLDDDGVIADERAYSASARVTQKQFEDAVAGKLPELAGKWLHALKWDNVPAKMGMDTDREQ